MLPRIAITMGDPAGIGPEIILNALSSDNVKKIARPVIVGDKGVLSHIARKLAIGFPKVEIINLSALDVRKLKPGKPDAATAAAMLEYIENAVGMALKGDVSAIVTAPINKGAARMAGFKFPGHTEFIAHLAGEKDFVMMFVGKTIKVSLVTIHEPIKKLHALISKEKIFKTIKITDESLKNSFGIKTPRIAVCGLNPHAGEGGIFGDEENTAIAPAIKMAHARGIKAIGPLPPDTVFPKALKGAFDCVVAMYHDQGLIPLKLLHFEDAVNATLGLPIIRTSVDHGTAYDIAWRGLANPASMIAAIEVAVQMARTRTV